MTALQPTERPHIDEFQLGGVSFKVLGMAALVSSWADKTGVRYLYTLLYNIILNTSNTRVM